MARNKRYGRVCWLCGRNGSADPLDRHHIFGGARRDKSERYGLVVDLCHFKCHEYGEKAAHRSGETAQLLHEYGQRKVMAEQGWTTEEFVLEFGKNYLPEEEAWGESRANDYPSVPANDNPPVSRTADSPLKVNCPIGAREAGLGHCTRGPLERGNEEGFCVLDDEGVDFFGAMAAFGFV